MRDKIAQSPALQKLVVSAAMLLPVFALAFVSVYGAGMASSSQQEISFVDFEERTLSPFQQSLGGNVSESALNTDELASVLGSSTLSNDEDTRVTVIATPATPTTATTITSNDKDEKPKPTKPVAGEIIVDDEETPEDIPVVIDDSEDENDDDDVVVGDDEEDVAVSDDDDDVVVDDDQEDVAVDDDDAAIDSDDKLVIDDDDDKKKKDKKKDIVCDASEYDDWLTGRQQNISYWNEQLAAENTRNAGELARLAELLEAGLVDEYLDDLNIEKTKNTTNLAEIKATSKSELAQIDAGEPAQCISSAS